MTAQEMFDMVVRAAREQGRFSVASPGKQCRYRSPGGDRCFFGHLIPDSVYESAMEGSTADGLLGDWADTFDAIGVPYSLSGLAVDLQVVHDRGALQVRVEEAFETRVPRELAEVARDYGLDPESIEEEAWVYKPVLYAALSPA